MKKENEKWLALAIVLTAPLLSVIDVFIINVAIPSIKQGVHATDAELQLVIAGYLLGYAGFLITGGRTGDHFGRKKIFFYGMLCFTLTSCLCGISTTPLQLNITRFFQGISSAFMVPQAIAFIQVLFSDARERSKAIGWFGITLGIASIIGQALGGVLAPLHGYIDGWRFIFFINLPIGIAALWATRRYLRETPRNEKQAFDYAGVLILTAALISLIYPLIEGREQGWPLWSLLLLLLSGLLFICFIRHQQRRLLHKKTPLIDLNLFRIRDFNIGLLAVLFHFMMHTTYLLISAVFLQNGLGISARLCGLFFVASGTLFMVSSLIAARLIHRYGKRVLQGGLLIMMTCIALQYRLFIPGVSNFTIFLIISVYGFGNGLVLPSLLNMALKSVPIGFAGAAAGVYSTFQQTASALGISIIGGLFYFFSNPGIAGSMTHRAEVALHAAPDYIRGYHYSMPVELGLLILVGGMLELLPAVSSPSIHEAVQHAVE